MLLTNPLDVYAICLQPHWGISIPLTTPLKCKHDTCNSNAVVSIVLTAPKDIYTYTPCLQLQRIYNQFAYTSTGRNHSAYNSIGALSMLLTIPLEPSALSVQPHWRYTHVGYKNPMET